MKVYIVESVFWDAYSDTLILLKDLIKENHLGKGAKGHEDYEQEFIYYGVPQARMQVCGKNPKE